MWVISRKGITTEYHVVFVVNISTSACSQECLLFLTCCEMNA